MLRDYEIAVLVEHVVGLVGDGAWGVGRRGRRRLSEGLLHCTVKTRWCKASRRWGGFSSGRRGYIERSALPCEAPRQATPPQRPLTAKQVELHGRLDGHGRVGERQHLVRRKDAEGVVPGVAEAVKAL